jgi:predicted DNA-binding antitoxin AbrB/MazE fold protein
MTIAVAAVYEDGVLKPEQPIALKDKAKVRLVIETPEADEAVPVDNEDPTGWKTARRFIGMWKGGTPGEAVGAEHDKYLYKGSSSTRASSTRSSR